MICLIHLIKMRVYNYNIGLNPLSANPTKCSNALKQFVGILWVSRLKG